MWANIIIHVTYTYILLGLIKMLRSETEFNRMIKVAFDYCIDSGVGGCGAGDKLIA